jgi:hypothetical protein
VPQTEKTPAEKSLYRSIFLITTFGIAFYQSNLSRKIGISTSIMAAFLPVLKRELPAASAHKCLCANIGS